MGWMWLKGLCPSNVKYWLKDSQTLERVTDCESPVRSYPEKMLQEFGSPEEINENVVIFCAYGRNPEEWRENLAWVLI